MKIKILSDSTCDLSKELLEKYDITLVPLTVVKNDESFADGVTITPDEIFSHVAAGGALCTTTALCAAEYQEIFEKYVNDYDGIREIYFSQIGILFPHITYKKMNHSSFCAGKTPEVIN